MCRAGQGQVSGSSLHVPRFARFDLRDEPVREQLILEPCGLCKAERRCMNLLNLSVNPLLMGLYGWAGFTKVAGWWLQLSIKAGLRCSEAALLVRMFAVEHHIFPVRNHAVRHVKWPAFHSTNNHAASLGRDETASCGDDQEGTTVYHKHEIQNCKLALWHLTL